MEQTKQPLQQFSALISDLIKLTKLMSDLLSEEAKAIQNRTPDVLGRLIERKKEIAQSLNVKTHQLDHFLTLNGFQGGKEGVNIWLQSIPNSNPIHAGWATLKKLTEACAKQNETNGASVRIMQQHARRSLDILRGKHQSDTFYGADGYSKRERLCNSILTV